VGELKHLRSAVTEDNNIAIEIEQGILMANRDSYGRKKQSNVHDV
jgi:hypothetical protein